MQSKILVGPIAFNGIRAVRWQLCAIVLVACAGCASPLSPRAIPRKNHIECDQLRGGDLIQRGEDRPVIDAIGWTIGIPSKIILWNRHVENHNIGLNTEAALREYLASNDLDTVRVRLNQYRPGEDWSRLVKNKSVGPGWRYTFGTLSVLGETLIPGRIFGGDHFNPYTNTIHLYSDVPAVALHEAAHAKDFARREYKGTYAAAYILPIVPLYHESVASRDVMAYLEQVGTRDDRAAAAKILYPAYGTYVSSAASYVVPKYADPIYVASVVGGHIAGRWEATKIMSTTNYSDMPRFADNAADSDPALQVQTASATTQVQSPDTQ